MLANYNEGDKEIKVLLEGLEGEEGVKVVCIRVLSVYDLEGPFNIAILNVVIKNLLTMVSKLF